MKKFKIQNYLSAPNNGNALFCSIIETNQRLDFNMEGESITYIYSLAEAGYQYNQPFPIGIPKHIESLMKNGSTPNTRVYSAVKLNKISYYVR